MIDSVDFDRGLNQHGHSFQHRVTHEIDTIYRANNTRWKPIGVEVPLIANERPIHSDIVLIDDWALPKCAFGVVECKRVNPSFGAWCFAKSPHSYPEWLSNQVCGEFINRVQEGHNRFESGGFGMQGVEPIFDIGFEIKLKKSGDKTPVANDKDALNQACSQSVMGMNGLANLLTEDSRFIARYKDVSDFWLLPIVVTTAKLYSSDVDLKQVDLESGNTSTSELNEHPWVIFQYPMSPLLKHSVCRGALGDDDFARVIARDYWRSVAIVTATGLADFLGTHLLDHFGDPKEV